MVYSGDFIGFLAQVMKYLSSIAFIYTIKIEKVFSLESIFGEFDNLVSKNAITQCQLR